MKVLRHDELPTRAPTILTAVVYLVLDRFHAPPAAWGAMGVVVLIVWITFFVSLSKQEQTPVQFAPRKPE